MSYFPLMIQLDQAPVLLVGGGRTAFHKARILVDFGACVRVVAPEVLPELEQLPVQVERRPFSGADLEQSDWTLVVAATDCRTVNGQVSRLVTRISQIKEIPAGDSVGYNRRWVAQRPSRIAIIPIGYADGLSRHLGYGNGRVLVGESEVPIIGSVCMDMCFLDVTGVACDEGQQVVFFGHADLLERNAAAAGTIPYEVLTSISPRVKRVYYQE